MWHYTQEELERKNKLFQTQKLFWDFLDMDIINKLVHLFDANSINSNKNIRKYIEDERALHNLDNTGVNIESYVYGYDKNNSYLYLGIKKNGKEIIHLTIHLSVTRLNPEDKGVIHISKNIYTKKRKDKKPIPYTIIKIQKSINKPNSLEFSIADNYTPLGISNNQLYELEIKKEMNIIIDVLNKLFNEDNTEYYIGNQNNLVPIHNKTNTVLENMNKHINHVSRKNKGKMMYPQFNNSPVYTMKHYRHRKTLKKCHKN